MMITVESSALHFTFNELLGSGVFTSHGFVFQRIFGEASEKNLYLSQLIILDTLDKCLAGVSPPLLRSWTRPPSLSLFDSGRFLREPAGLR